MSWVWGSQTRGIVEEVDGDRIETEFFVLGFLSVFPLKSYLRFRDGSRIALRSLHPKSVCLGYARSYLPILVFGLLLLAVIVAGPYDTDLVAVGIASLGAFVLAILGLAVLERTRSVSKDEARSRRMCAVQVGCAMSPQRINGARPTFRPELEKELKARLSGVVGVNYREEYDPFSIAEKLDDTDIDILRLLVVLAPLCDRNAEGALLWQRIAKLPDALLFAPKTHVSSSVAEPHVPTKIDVAQRGPVPTLATKPGSPVSSGVEVEFARGPYPIVFPPTCASCLGPRQTSAAVRKHFGPFSKTANILVPYCLACSDHDFRERSRQSLVNVLRVIGLASLGLFAVPLSIPVALLVVTPLFLLAGVASLWSAAPNQALSPATTTMGAFALLWRAKKTTTFFCTNPLWAKEFAAANDGIVRESKLLSAGYGNALALAAAALLLIGGWMYRLGTPVVYIDLQNQEPMVVWLDGKIVATLPPHSGARGHRVRIPSGRHQIGIGMPDGKGPLVATNVVIEFDGNHLYDPLQQHCYYMDRASIFAKKASSAYAHFGSVPLELKKFYTFETVDYWLDDNPITITHDKEGMRLAIKRAPLCEKLEGCSLEIRSQAWSCVLDPGQPEEVVQACVDKLVSACARP